METTLPPISDAITSALRVLYCGDMNITLILSFLAWFINIAIPLGVGSLPSFSMAI